VNIYLKLLITEAFSAHYAPNSVWRLSSARTSEGSLQRSLRSPSWIKESLLLREGMGREWRSMGWEGEGGGGKWEGKGGRGGEGKMG